MAKTKANPTGSKPANAPSAEALSQLARTLIAKKDAGGGAPTGDSARPDPPAAVEVPAPTAAAEPNPPQRRCRKKTTDDSSVGEAGGGSVPVPKKSAARAEKELKASLRRAKVEKKEITADDLIQADAFDPKALPFQLKWDNFDRLKAFYALTDAETTSIMLAMVGPNESGREYWGKFKVPHHLFDADGVFRMPNNDVHVEARVEADFKRLSEELGDATERAPSKRGVAVAASDEPDAKKRRLRVSRTALPEPETAGPPDESRDDASMDGESMSDEDGDSDEDLFSGSSGVPPPPPAPTNIAGAVSDDGDDGDFREPHEEPERMKIDEDVVLAKHALQENIKKVATPAKAKN